MAEIAVSVPVVAITATTPVNAISATAPAHVLTVLSIGAESDEPPPPDPWVPSDLPGLALWLDANDASTITLSGANVTEWRDKSGNGRNAVQGDNSKRPTSTLRTVNGRPVISATPVQTLTVDGGSLFAGQVTLLAVITWQSVLPYGMAMFLTDITISNNRGIFFYTKNGVEAASYPQWAGGSFIDGVGSAPHSTPHIMGFRGAAPTERHRLVVNGTSFEFPTVMTPYPSDSRILDIFGGTALALSFSQTPDLDVAEVICYEGAVSDADYQRAEGYLAHRWGLADSLPAEHPYKGAPP